MKTNKYNLIKKLIVFIIFLSSFVIQLGSSLEVKLAHSDEKIKNNQKAKNTSEPETEGPSKPVNASLNHQTDTKILSLQECLNRSLANSHELASQKHKLAALGEQVEQVWWIPFSGFRLNGLFSVVPDKCIDEQLLEDEGRLMGCDGNHITGDDEDYGTSWGPTFHIELRGGIPIYTFGKIDSSRKAAKAAYKAKESLLPTIEHKIKFNVMQAFHAIVGAREMLYTLSEGKKHLVKARKKTEQNLENQEGTETEIDLLKLKVFEAQVEAMTKQTKQIVLTGLAALNFLVGSTNGHKIDVSQEPQDIISKKIDTLENYQRMSLNQRPELGALRHAVKAIDAKVDMSKADFFPDLLLVFGLRYGVTPGRTDISNWVLSDRANYGSWIPSFALTLSYNLNFGMDVHKLRETKAQYEAVLEDYQMAIAGILLEVEVTYIEVVSNKETIDALKKSKRLTKGWMAAAVQNHAAGLGDSKDVKDALKEYFGIMAQLHQKIGEYNISLAKLDKVTGVFNKTSE